MFAFSAMASEPGYMNMHSVDGTADESIALNNIRKITFSKESVDVWQKDETTFSMPYATLGKIAFGEQLSSGIEEIQEVFDETIVIAYRSLDGNVVVSSTSVIEHVSVYNMQGHLVVQLLPRAERVELSLTDYPVAIYIVKATDGKTIKTQKIIKK